MDSSKHILWPARIVGVFLGLLQYPIYIVLEKTLNSSGGYTVISNWLLQELNIPFDQDISLGITWWSVAMLAGISLGAFFSSRMSKRKFRIYSGFWKETAEDSLLKRIFLGSIGGFLMGLGLRMAGDGTNFEELSSIAKLQFHSMLTIGIIFAIGIFFTRRWYSSRI